MASESDLEGVPELCRSSLSIQHRSLGVEETVTVLWSVPEFSSYARSDQVVKSPPFSMSSFESLETFHIISWPNGEKTYYSSTARTNSIDLALVTGNRVSFSYELLILSSTENVEHERIRYTKENDGITKIKKHSFRRSNKLNGNDTLNVECKVTVKSSVESLLSRKHFTDKIKLSSDLGKLFGSNQLSDVTIFVKDKVIPAHKCILSARSPVFKAMFSSGLKESLGSTVDIDDMEDAVVEGMIAYIYTGISPNLKSLAPKMIAAAEKYQLASLKDVCELQMTEDLSKNNFCEYYNLSVKFDLMVLRNRCLNFLSKNAGHLLSDLDFDQVLSRLENAKEIIKYFFELLNGNELIDNNKN